MSHNDTAGPRVRLEICTSSCRFGIPAISGGDGQFANPGGIAVDGSGNVFVDDTRQETVQKFTNTGSFVTKWGSLGGGAGQFNFNGFSGVAMDASGNVFVADGNNERIDEFTNTGTFVLAFGWGVADGMGTFENCTSVCQAGIDGGGNGQFNICQGVAVDASQDLFVADSNTQRVQKFTCP